MKSFLLYTANGPVIVLTTFDAVTSPGLLNKLHGKGVDKFMAWELPLPAVQERYAGHYFVVEHDLRETEDVRFLDCSGDRIFRLFQLDALKRPICHEGGEMQS
jgi:hypothetical protein